MNLVTQLLAIVAVLFHVVAFVLESFLFHRPNVQTFLLGRPASVERSRSTAAPSWLRAASYCSFPTAGCGAA